MTPKPSWTAEDRATIIRMWNNGKSGGQISIALGRRHSRSAVLGMVNRLPECKPRDENLSRVAGTTLVRVQAIVKARLAPPAPPAEPRWLQSDVWKPLQGSSPVLVRDHKSGCKWPVGDSPIMFCNETCEGTYCAAHHARAVNPIQPTRSQKPL